MELISVLNDVIATPKRDARLETKFLLNSVGSSRSKEPREHDDTATTKEANTFSESEKTQTSILPAETGHIKETSELALNNRASLPKKPSLPTATGSIDSSTSVRATVNSDDTHLPSPPDIGDRVALILEGMKSENNTHRIKANEILEPTVQYTDSSGASAVAMRESDGSTVSLLSSHSADVTELDPGSNSTSAPNYVDTACTSGHISLQPVQILNTSSKLPSEKQKDASHITGLLRKRLNGYICDFARDRSDGLQLEGMKLPRKETVLAEGTCIPTPSSTSYPSSQRFKLERQLEVVHTPRTASILPQHSPVNYPYAFQPVQGYQPPNNGYVPGVIPSVSHPVPPHVAYAYQRSAQGYLLASPAEPIFGLGSVAPPTTVPAPILQNVQQPHMPSMFIAPELPMPSTYPMPVRAMWTSCGPHIPPVQPESEKLRPIHVIRRSDARNHPLTALAKVKTRRTRKRHRSIEDDTHCQQCGTRSTPEWRRGPDGLRTLCNACGLYHAKIARKKGEAEAERLLRERRTAGAS